MTTPSKASHERANGPGGAPPCPAGAPAHQLCQAGIGPLFQGLLGCSVALQRGPHQAHLVGRQGHEPGPAPLGVAEHGRLVQCLPLCAAAVGFAATAAVHHYRAPHEAWDLRTLPAAMSIHYPASYLLVSNKSRYCHTAALLWWIPHVPAPNEEPRLRAQSERLGCHSRRAAPISYDVPLGTVRNGVGVHSEDRGASSGTRHWRLPGRVTSDGGRGAMLTSDGRGSQVPMSGLTRSARTSKSTGLIPLPDAYVVQRSLHGEFRPVTHKRQPQTRLRWPRATISMTSLMT